MILGNHQDSNLEASYRLDMQNAIRREKFTFVLPHALKNNGVDMWIHVVKRGSFDPLSIDLGGDGGIFIYTLIDSDRVEKAAFDTDFSWFADEALYDVIGERRDVFDYIKSKAPKSVVINTSKLLTHCDGFSLNDLEFFESGLGKKEVGLWSSSEDVITEFRSRRVASEIVLMGKLCESQRRVMERSFRSIIPGKTTRYELGLFGQSELLRTGYSVGEIALEAPYVVHSSTSGEDEIDCPDYIIQPGDYLVWDWGTERKHMNFGTDFKRHVYILKEDENELPKGLENAWKYGIKAREVLRRTIKAGMTSEEALSKVVKAIEAAGFVYTPFTDTAEDRNYLTQLGDSEKVGFSIDCHCVGNSGNSELAVGPSMAPFRNDRARFTIHPNTMIAFEFVVLVWIPEWNKRIMLNLEDNAVVTEYGVEAMYPYNRGIILVK